MVSDSNHTNPERLPIKLVMPNQGIERRVNAGGSRPIPFRIVDTEFRNGIINQIDASRTALSQPLLDIGIAPIRVKLISRAIAKSHRPERLFSAQTCPIIGVGGPGELFVKATPTGLDSLKAKIRGDSSPYLIKELSEVESIEPITPSLRRSGVSSLDILRHSPGDNSGYFTKVRLFDLDSNEDTQRLVSDFKARCAHLGMTVSEEGYSESSYTYSVVCCTTEQVEALSSIIGVRNVAPMPLLRTERPQTYNPISPFVFPHREEVIGEVPVVVVVDSGVSSDNPGLESWVVGRDSSVAPPYRNEDHGTFVAGLICCGNYLNPHIAGIDASPCAVFDLQVMPNTDPGKGRISTLTEQELLVTLENALRQYANDFKVWNLSLGTDSICSRDDFSSFAVELDNLQEKYKVSFVISAGNYQTLPLLGFPRTGPEINNGRITIPADSVLGIAVGSISHVDNPPLGPHQNEPAPYSRHGAGPNYVIKPDLVHYGGTCSVEGGNPNCVRSLSGATCAEMMGTSFAAPLVSKTLAQIYHRVIPTPSPVLARALLIHHARDPRTNLRVPDGQEDFFGFGLPAPAPYCLECTSSSATLVFDDVLRPGFNLEWDHFPYPESLSRDGKFFGEVWMTVAFAPARGSRWGSEYCESHIEAHFGVYQNRVNRTTGEVTTHFRGLVPPEHNNPGELYESYQVSALRKWAPVRTYHGKLGERGKRGNHWRLKVCLLNRHGADLVGESLRPQPFSLIVTIADPEGVVPVYDEVVRSLRNRFHTENLSLRSTARITRSV